MVYEGSGMTKWVWGVIYVALEYFLDAMQIWTQYMFLFVVYFNFLLLWCPGGKLMN